MDGNPCHSRAPRRRRLRRFARRDRSRQGGGTEQGGPEKPEPEKPEPAPAFVLMLSEAEAMNFRISVEPDDSQRNYFVGITTRADFDRLKTAQAVAETLVELEKGYGTIDSDHPRRSAHLPRQQDDRCRQDMEPQTEERLCRGGIRRWCRRCNYDRRFS